MKKRALRILLLVVVAIYSVAFIISAIVFVFVPEFINSFISLVPFIVAIPAALLTRAFQRRASYIKSLQEIWPTVVEAGRKAIEYPNIKNPTEEQFRDVILTLSYSIDYLRMLFKNVKEFYPVESIKTIYQEFDKIRDTYKFNNPNKARDRIAKLWHQARDSILEEFDRVIPTNYDAPEFEGDL